MVLLLVVPQLAAPVPFSVGGFEGQRAVAEFEEFGFQGFADVLVLRLVGVCLLEVGGFEGQQQRRRKRVPAEGPGSGEDVLPWSKAPHVKGPVCPEREVTAA